jgi:uncharacterized protein
MRFAWDLAKAKSNRSKHGVSFEEACTVFVDPAAVVANDAVHDERTVIIGMSAAARVLFAVFIEVSHETEEEIRIISARRATSRERKIYEEGDF